MRVASAVAPNYGILREYVGHGIGRKMHEAPSLFNYRTPDRGAEVRPGLVLAIEPMVTAGSDETYIEDDDWTVTTVDGSDGAHWEHSVALHDEGIWVLTAEDGGRAGLAPFGIEPAHPVSTGRGRGPACPGGPRGVRAAGERRASRPRHGETRGFRAHCHNARSGCTP